MYLFRRNGFGKPVKFPSFQDQILPTLDKNKHGYKGMKMMKWTLEHPFLDGQLIKCLTVRRTWRPRKWKPLKQELNDNTEKSYFKSTNSRPQNFLW